jgi:hypothetical protein
MQWIKEGLWHSQHDRAADDDRFGVPAYEGVGPGHLDARAALSKRGSSNPSYRKFPVCPNE